MANAEQAEQANFGTFECVYCGEEFTKDNPCWNDDGIYYNGSHRDGECERCAQKQEAQRGIGARFIPTLQHERGE